MAHATFSSAKMIPAIEKAIYYIPIAVKKAIKHDDEDLKEFGGHYSLYRTLKMKNHEYQLKRILLLAKANYHITLTDKEYDIIERYSK